MSTPASAWVKAPAKVNLFLRVLDRRDDGFHELETLFQSVGLFDEVRVSGTGGGVALQVEGPDLGPLEANLAYRAAAAFLRAAGGRVDGGVGVQLVKRIPAGAGLGGGSSDAAAVLRCLQTLWPEAVSADELVRLAADLGSDVPFFLGPSPLALGRGRGELLTPLPPLPPASLVLVLPPVHVATGGAYGALAGTRVGARREERGPSLPPGGRLAWEAVAALAHNDFERVVPGAYEPVARSLDALRRVGASPALLSGSGGACFGGFADAATAARAARELEETLGWPAVAVETLGELPEVVSA